MSGNVPGFVLLSLMLMSLAFFAASVVVAVYGETVLAARLLGYAVVLLVLAGVLVAALAPKKHGHGKGAGSRG